jgi:hypothetical protein
MPRPPRRPDIGALLRKAGKAAEKVLVAEVAAFSHRECDAFKHKIETQQFDSFRFRPLQSWYVAMKRRLRRDTRVMIATGEYLKSIQVWEVPRQSRDALGRFGTNTRSANVHMWTIGIPLSARVRDMFTRQLTNVPMVVLAKEQEYGSSKGHVPARPHWHPFFMEMVTKDAPRFAATVAPVVSKAIRATMKGARR